MKLKITILLGNCGKQEIKLFTFFSEQSQKKTPPVQKKVLKRNPQ